MKTFASILPAGKGLLQRRGLGLGIGQQRRAAAEMGIDRAGHRGPPARDQPGERPAQRLRQADDRGIAEQVVEKRLDRFLGYRAHPD